jgi:hypothetical protein
MDAQQLYEVWAPPESVWSRWAKPVLFAAPGQLPSPATTPAEGAGGLEGLRFATWSDPQTAYVIDLPGARSIEAGLELARARYRPVPLFNTTHHPFAVISVLPILEWLASGAEELRALSLPPQAPPVFLLDSRRLSPAAPPGPGKFDNRWVVFPQDFPSAGFLHSQGIRRVVLLQEKTGEPPALDLAHVLLRWKQGGLELFVQAPGSAEPPQPLDVRKPTYFRSLFYRAMTLAGLRRSSAGGFGAIIPVAAAGSGFS